MHVRACSSYNWNVGYFYVIHLLLPLKDVYAICRNTLWRLNSGVIPATLSLEPPAQASNNVKLGMRSAAEMPPSESPFFQVWNATDKRVECSDREFRILRVLSAPAERTLGIRSFFGALLIIIRLGKVNSFLFPPFFAVFCQFLGWGSNCSFFRFF